MRPYLYLALLGTACLLLLPLRGALVPPPAWTAAPGAVAAREGLYTQDLLPGESRIYVLEMPARSLFKVRFSGSGGGLGLRMEDGDGVQVGAVPPVAQPTGLDRRLGVVNPAATPRTLYLTVYRNAGPALKRLVLHGGHVEPKALAGADLLVVGGGSGAYALELTRGAMP